MKECRHVFHTKHDFTPEFAWSVFQLLAHLPIDGVTIVELAEIANSIASPLARRSELHKPLAAFYELGILRNDGTKISLTACGSAISEGLGRLEQGFYVAIHCIYAWKWVWDN